MRTKTVEVVIQPGGQLQIEAHGFTGTGCEAATQFLEEALGSPGARKRKGEYYRSPAVRAKRQQRLGGGQP
jgi:hypothetical protein